MRIGLDMLAVQSPGSAGRGIGRYSANLVSSLLARNDNEFVLYIHDGLTTKYVPFSSRAQTHLLRKKTGISDSAAARIDRIARNNPDKLDALVILSPLETWDGYSTPARPDNGLKIVSVVYDLIPFLFQKEDALERVMPRLYKALEKIKSYDALLAISECTRTDILTVLRLTPDHVVNIQGASDSGLFQPAARPLSDAETGELALHGIRRPFIFNVGGEHDRKNHFRLIEAFAALPDRLRNSHQLVLTCKVSSRFRECLSEYANKRGIGDALAITGEVGDHILRLLYQYCAAFVFPSLYEGFGLPILEALRCGAPVVAGNNSSQIEVLGDAGILAEANDSHDIAVKIATILDDPALAQSFRSRAVAQAARFSWEKTAAQTLATLTSVVERPRRGWRNSLASGKRHKPTIAFFSPLPPKMSGISDYSAQLLEELRKNYTIDLYHDHGYVPEPALGCEEFMTCDARQFERIASVKEYHAIIYQMGNSIYHNFMYPIMLRHRGVVTLHDLCLAGFHLSRIARSGAGLALVRDHLLRWYPESSGEILTAFEEWGDDSDAISSGCASKGWWMNRDVLEAAQVIVVHSPWCKDQIQLRAREHLDRVAVVPFGVRSRNIGSADRAAIRDRFLLPRDALIVASFGFVGPTKMCTQAIDAFLEVARLNPDALFVFAGEERDGGVVRRYVNDLNLSHRVRFLGRLSSEAFDAVMNATDLGVNLRLPPTNGETSAALMNLLASGVATVVTDVDTFSDLPSNVVRKVHWQTEGQDGLNRDILELATDRAKREAIGRAARTYSKVHHDWSRVGSLYVEAIERCHAELAGKPQLHYQKRSA